jgi:plastocyanin
MEVLTNSNNLVKITVIVIVVATILITTTTMMSGTPITPTKDYQVFAKSDKNSDSAVNHTGVDNPTTTTNNNSGNQAGSGGKNQVVIVGIKHAKSFSPNPIEIKVGDTVTWTNDHREAHTVTSKSSAFDSGDIQPSQSYSHKFDKAGSFQYYCVIHPSMVGEVDVS